MIHAPRFSVLFEALRVANTTRATIVPWLIALAMVAAGLAGCGSEDVGRGSDGGAFLGEGQDSDAPETDVPVSGQSRCSLFDPESCEDGRACTPTANGVRVCEKDATLEVGAACDPSGDARCVGGSLCFDAGNAGAFCIEVCDTKNPQCVDGTCNPWFEIDGESVGRCEN